MAWLPFTKNLKNQFNNKDKFHVIDIVACFRESNLVEREKAEAQFKAEVKRMSDWKPSKIQQWAQQQVENDYSILSSRGYDEYWRALEIDKNRNEAEAAEAKSYYQTRKDSAKRSHDQSSDHDEYSNKKQKQSTTQQNSSAPAATTARVDNVPQDARAIVNDIRQSARAAVGDVRHGDMAGNDSQEQAEKWIEKLHSLSDKDKLLFIYEKFGKENSLDLTDKVYHSRYWTHISQLVGFLGLPYFILQDEAEWLGMIRECDGLEELYMVKQHFFKQAHVSPGREYIRSALHKVLLLWESAKLPRKNNEGWYQINLYGPLFDDVFLEAKQYDTKRTECASTAIEAYHELLSSSLSSSPLPSKHQKHKVDFALRDINCGSDVMVGEDKPSHTGHKDINETITKNKRVRVAALDVLQKKLPFKELISKFDEYTTFWHGTDLQICGTRRIDGIDIHYEAAHVCVSRVPGDFKGLVKLMIVVLSIKRQSIRVYEQLGAINHAIFDLSLEYPSLSMLPNSSKDDSFEFDDKELKKLLYDLPCPPDKKEKCVQDAIYDADLKFKKNFLAASKLHDILVNPHHAMDKISFIEPKVDIVEEESGSFQVAVELPGIEKRDIKVGIKGNIFWIDAKSRLFYDNSTKIHIQECNKHHFHRQITLPIFVRASDCSSSFENGLLIIKIKPTAVDLDHISIS